MQVMCISHETVPGDWRPYDERDPAIGETCTVVHSYYHSSDGALVYDLAGYEVWSYNARNFAPLSDIDETELIKQREPKEDAVIIR